MTVGQTGRGENRVNEIKRLKKKIIASFAISILLARIFVMILFV